MPTPQQIDKLLKERYYLKNETTWEDIANRVSNISPNILKYILNKDFIPSTPTLMNANTNGERVGTLSSCFPMKISDSMDDIMGSMVDAAKVTQYGGGVGFMFDSLRGSNEVVNSTGRNSGGPLSFIGIYNAVLDGVMQGGARRGAGMSMLSIYHPNILDFINAKLDGDKFKRNNFSIRIPNKFYDILLNNPKQIFKTVNVIDKAEHDLIDANGVVYTYEMLWGKIIENAWLSAEPGIFNSDIAYNQCTVTNVDTEVLSNPCQEFTNIPLSSCNLGSVNVYNMIVNGKFDHDKYKNTIQESTTFLNSVIDVNNYPLEKIKDVTLKIRAIGLGFMGLAHAMYKLGIGYASLEGKKFTEYAIKTLTLESMKQSIELAKISGPYPAFDYDLYVSANKRLFDESEFAELLPDIKKYGIRNSSQTSIAPTGTISFIANTSGGLEPVFALAYIRRIEKINQQFEEVFITDDIFDSFLDENYPNTKIDILKEVVNNNGSCQKSKIMKQEHKDIFVVAADLSPMDHLDILSIVSKYTSMSVSKTINLPSDISKERVSEVYLEAYKRGIIGVTVYRDGCRDGILITKKSENKADEVSVDRHSPKRPELIDCEVNVYTVKKKQYYVIVGVLDNKPYEVFTGENYTNTGDIFISKNIKTGSIKKLKKENKDRYLFIDTNGIEYDISNGHSLDEAEALSRQISLNLRHKNAPIQYIVEQLNKSEGLTTFPKVIARSLKHFIEDNTKSSQKCPNCDSQLVYTEGCISCKQCGYSKCA